MSGEHRDVVVGSVSVAGPRRERLHWPGMCLDRRAERDIRGTFRADGVRAAPVAWAVVSDRITPEAVAKVAKLARLSLTDHELQQATHQLSDMLDHFADIDALDLDGVEPMTHPTPIANVMREDIEMDCLDRDEVLAAAPAAEDGRFRVPPIVGLED
jgi:aspartyl-tRNA(Asn)/glutamyl-tRNA(Gln) amidotransferase subunit C